MLDALERIDTSANEPSRLGATLFDRIRRVSADQLRMTQYSLDEIVQSRESGEFAWRQIQSRLREEKQTSRSLGRPEVRCELQYRLFVKAIEATGGTFEEAGVGDETGYSLLGGRSDVQALTGLPRDNDGRHARFVCRCIQHESSEEHAVGVLQRRQPVQLPQARQCVPMKRRQRVELGVSLAALDGSAEFGERPRENATKYWG